MTEELVKKAPGRLAREYWSRHSKIYYWMAKDLKWFFMRDWTDSFDLFMVCVIRVFDLNDYEQLKFNPENAHGKSPADYAMDYALEHDRCILTFIKQSHDLLSSFHIEWMFEINSVMKWNVKRNHTSCLPKFHPRRLFLKDQWITEARQILEMRNEELAPTQKFQSLVSILHEALGPLKKFESVDLVHEAGHLSMFRVNDTMIPVVCIMASQHDLEHHYEKLAGEIMVHMYLAFEHNRKCPGYAYEYGLVYGIVTSGTLWTYWKFDGKKFSRCADHDRLNLPATDRHVQEVIASKVMCMAIESLLLLNFRFKLGKLPLRKILKAFRKANDLTRMNRALENFAKFTRAVHSQSQKQLQLQRHSQLVPSPSSSTAPQVSYWSPVPSILG